MTSCGVTTTKVTPSESVLSDVRDGLKSTESETKWFLYTHVEKILCLAKSVKPECLTAVAFLSTRVTITDIDDLAKQAHTHERHSTQRRSYNYGEGVH